MQALGLGLPSRNELTVCHCESRLAGRGNPSEIIADGHVASLLAMTDFVHYALHQSATRFVCPLAMTVLRNHGSATPRGQISLAAV
jgi:hypothetical protein